jgi:hypothetical protein
MTGLEHVISECWLAWMRRGRTAHAYKSDAGWNLVLTRRERWSMLAIGICFCLFYSWTFAAGYLSVGGPSWKGILLGWSSIALWIVVVAGTLATWLERVTVSNAGVVRRSLWRSRRITWPTLTRVEAIKLGNGIKLVDNHGVTIPISGSLDGLPVLVDHLDRYAPADKAVEARLGLGLFGTVSGNGQD